MSLLNDLTAATTEAFRVLTVRDGRVVPEAEDVALGADAVKLEAVVVYADIAESTKLVSSNYVEEFPPKIYKAYLACACRVIRANGGVITAFDGDRVMAVFIGNDKYDSAVISGMQIQWAVTNIINPLIPTTFTWKSIPPYQLKQAVGIDAGTLIVARTGIRGSNDLVWSGKAANFAAKLSSIREAQTTWISKVVYDKMSFTATYHSKTKENMWLTANRFGESVYCTSTSWVIS